MFWGLFRKKERIDCETCNFYVEEEGSGCIPFSRGSHEEARELCKADRRRRGREQEDCEVCSSHAYRENDVRKMCSCFGVPLWKMAVLNHPAATGSWHCLNWKSKRESGKVLLTEKEKKANRDLAYKVVESVIGKKND